MMSQPPHGGGPEQREPEGRFPGGGEGPEEHRVEKVVIAADLTREQWKEEADMVQEAERRNANLSEYDRAKKLVWMAEGRRRNTPARRMGASAERRRRTSPERRRSNRKQSATDSSNEPEHSRKGRSRREGEAD